MALIGGEAFATLLEDGFVFEGIELENQTFQESLSSKARRITSVDKRIIIVNDN